MLQERKSWAIKDTALLEELGALLDLNDQDKLLLEKLGSHTEHIAPQMVETFYQRLFAHPATAEYLQGVTMERLHSMTSEWFMDLFRGPHDNDYVQRRIAIGHIHVRIGLPIRYPLAMLDVILQFGAQITQHSEHPEAALRAFQKLVALDIAIFNQAYEDHQLRHLTHLVGNERLARRLLMKEQQT